RWAALSWFAVALAQQGRRAHPGHVCSRFTARLKLAGQDLEPIGRLASGIVAYLPCYLPWGTDGDGEGSVLDRGRRRSAARSRAARAALRQSGADDRVSRTAPAVVSG